MRPPVEQFALGLDAKTQQAVARASAMKTAGRPAVLAGAFTDVEAARQAAAETRDYVLDHLHDLLVEYESNATSNGWVVHWASDAHAARQIVLDILRDAPAGPVVKGKSMATEEIHLNAAIESAGRRVVETDLGEFVVQIDGDTPSHIVTPIIHKNREQVGESFAREGLGPRTDDPATLAYQARVHLREAFRTAAVGISGVNFALVQEGAVVVVENEGNNRLSTTAPPIHIAVMGIEKLLPSAADLPVFLRLLAGSATGQRITTYTHLIRGPRRSDERDGPEQTHIILLDNGRSEIMKSRQRAILRCIRCGACLNVCPVYRQVSGHGYRHPYSGPLGAVLAPSLEGLKAYGDLAKASTLCGACEEVCPVRIPIPDMLVQIRHRTVRQVGDPSPMPWTAYASAATHPGRWQAAVHLLPEAGGLPFLFSGWTQVREAPRAEGRRFRSWWKSR
ncbi:MAG: lactate utilization protein [Methanoregulaceae archaeon]|nr:lactate utilization protein [Methanoregulaceae archaeon]